jgi:hypothetical protein
MPTTAATAATAQSCARLDLTMERLCRVWRAIRRSVRLPVPLVHVQAPLESGATVANVHAMALLDDNRRGRPGPEVTGLIDRIKKLVAEQRRMDDRDGDARRDSNRREIARLKWRLANVVKRELSPGPGLRFALAFRH